MVTAKKTTTINAMIHFFESEGMDIFLAAPTGRAAKRMTEATGCEARTIHRMLELAYAPGNDDNRMEFARNQENPLETDVIIIDDMISSGESMLDVAKQVKERGADHVFVCTTFGLFTDGLEKFDAYYEKGYISKVVTTDLTYRTPELVSRPWYEPAEMSKYMASIIDTLNHDVSVAKVQSTTEKINKLLAKHR